MKLQERIEEIQRLENQILTEEKLLTDHTQKMVNYEVNRNFKLRENLNQLR